MEIPTHILFGRFIDSFEWFECRKKIECLWGPVILESDYEIPPSIVQYSLFFHQNTTESEEKKPTPKASIWPWKV